MIRISPDSPLKSKIQHANKKTMRKMTALFKNRTMVQASTLGPHKHKRERLRYLGDLCGVSIRKSEVDFERVFEVEKRLKK